MKKKFIGFALAVALILPLAFLFSACGGKKVTGVRLENFFAGEAKVEYEYGATLNDIISTNLKVFADFDDGSSQELTYGEYKITYRKDGQTISHISPIPDVGYYTLEYSYENIATSQSFYIIPTNNSPYTINLPQKTWTYADSVENPTLDNYELQEGETVTWYYIAKETYDNLTEIEKRNVTGYAIEFIDLSLVNAGEHYIFAKINFIQTSNYTGVTQIDENALVTVNKKTITLTEADIKNAQSEAYFTETAQTLADIEIQYNQIPLDSYRLYVNLVWKNPETAISASDVGKAFDVGFEFANPDDAINYTIICNESLTLLAAKA